MKRHYVLCGLDAAVSRCGYGWGEGGSSRANPWSSPRHYNSLSPSHSIGEENAWSLDSQYWFLHSESTQPATAMHCQLQKWMQHCFDSITFWERIRKRYAVWIVIRFKSYQTACQSIWYNYTTRSTSSPSEFRYNLTLIIIHSFCPFSKIFCFRQLGLRPDYIHVSLRGESM